MCEVTRFIQDLLNENYNLGEVKRVEKIKAGDTNNSFLAYCDNGGMEEKWYVRQYNPAEEERDIIYEHAFEEYFNERIDSNIQTLLPIRAKNAKTWVIAEFNGQANFYAVFNTISGREPYSWEYNNLSDEALDSCAEITAKFHAWAYGFEGPEGSGRREPSLKEQFANWRKDLPRSIADKEMEPEIYQRFTDYLKTEEGFLFRAIDFCEEKLDAYEKDLKMCINHKDLNPGNVMFDDNDRVSAVFDLDWVNTDYRLYDIGWMGYQAMASWDTSTWGVVPMDKMSRFLEIYDNTICEYGCPLGGLTTREKEFLPVMMIIGALKVIMDFCCYEDHAHDVHRVFVNTWRFVNSVHYMIDNNQAMVEAIMKGEK